MMDTIFRVNVSSRTVVKDAAPEGWERLGGRGLISRILWDEVTPRCDSLGPFNKLLFVPGLLVGHMLSSCDRLSVGGKSPLTGGTKESNAGGTTALKLTHLGIKALIVEGDPGPDGWRVVHISEEGGRFEKADGLLGKGVYESAALLLERYGPNVWLRNITSGIPITFVNATEPS